MAIIAFRDAIAGHMELLRIGILHRDISTDNILENLRNDVVAGNRGLIIDFDMAIFLNRQTSGAAKDFRTGTRAFQSVKVLKGLGFHDYLDDLESFFYVFCWICLAYKGPGVSLEEFPTLLRSWSSADVEQASNAKQAFLLGTNLQIQDGFTYSAQELVDKLCQFFLTKSTARVKALLLWVRKPTIQGPGHSKPSKFRTLDHPDGADPVPEASSPISDIGCNDWLTLGAKADYTTILNWIDGTIEEWREYKKAQGETSEKSLSDMPDIPSREDDKTVAEDVTLAEESYGATAGPLSPTQNIDATPLALDPHGPVLKRAQGFVEPEPDSRIVKKVRCS